MTVHTEYSLRRACITKVLDLLLAVSTSETLGAESLISGQDGQVFNFVVAGAAAVRAVTTDKGSIA
jgi:hypothetical protein